ncbi:MAG: hypothetical protein IPP71_09455 [Bacteroidetes bacterium]|nr:hypothetical protein [Bacteroidota bacterium]
MNDFNYGLCLPQEEGSASLNLKINIDPAKIIRVQLLSCRAITAGGSRIEFGMNQGLKLNTDTEKLIAEYHFEDSKEKLFYVLITANIQARIPAGLPDTEETPPRFPFVRADYQLQILPDSQINLDQPSANSLVIGCLSYQAGKMKVSDNFIPASMMVNCHPALQEFYFKTGNLLGETGKNIAIIIDKIHGKSQSTSLVKSCMTLCQSTSDYIADNLGSYRWILSNQPPVYMLDCFLRMAYKISMTLSNLPVKDKEELINYICEWVEETPNDINEKINRLIRSEYKHTDVSSTLVAAEEFIHMTHNVFFKLSQLDFIGKKKESGHSYKKNQ